MLSSEECDKLEVWGLSLHTTYKYNLQYSNSFNQTDRLKGAACFRSLYNNIRYADCEKGQNIISQASLTVQVGIKPQLNYENSYDNLTVLTPEEIKTFLDELVAIFTYKNTTVTYSIETVDTNWINVVIQATNIRSFYIKFIAAYIRYMYETPCNWILKEACLLKEQDSRFKDYPLFSIFVFFTQYNKFLSCLYCSTY